ncbi:MAG: hemerythrin family protein [Gammaproteobacteria bacterium]|nr:hemerythrin family protein [Gammaproteobacteria bacterium]
MNLLEWRPEFSTGIKSVDHEHQELIGLINDTLESIRAHDSADNIQASLSEIYVHISSHFALEERIMRKRKYDRYQQHKAEHEKLLDDIRDIMDYHADHGEFDEEYLADRLSDWFAKHFRTEDARLHRMIG